MVRKPFYAFVFFVLTACIGCGATNSEKVVGVWRTAKKRADVPGFIEIRKDKLIRDGGDDSIDIVLEDKDDKVSVRAAGTDRVLAVITVIDDNNIEIAFQGMFAGDKEKLVRSSAEEMHAVFNPPKENIIGVWRTEREGDAGIPGILEIASDALVFDGEKTPVSLSTHKGVYVATAARPDGKWNFVLGDDDKLHLRTVMSGQTYVRSSPDEAAAAASARTAFIEKHHGFWKEVEARHGEPFGFLEIGEGFVDDNGERVETNVALSRNGVKLTRRDNGRELMTVSLDESGHLRVSKGYFSDRVYERGNREELEKINNPKLEHVIGFWLLDDPEADSYKTVELAPDYIVRDRRREETKPVQSRNRFALAIARREPKEMRWFDVTRIDDDHIFLSYGSFGEHRVRYRRADKAEYDQAAAGTVNPLEIIVGYWRSAEPVQDTRGERVVHATAVFATGVKGETAPVVDWSSASFIGSSTGVRNRSFGDSAKAREGVWVYPMGRVSVPLELYNFARQHGSWVQIKIVDANTLDIAEDGKNFVRCVRSTLEEVVRLRAMIKQ